MSVEIHAAIVAGLISGSIVLVGILLQHRIMVEEDRRRRRQELLAVATERLFSSIGVAAMAHRLGDADRLQGAVAAYGAQKAVLLAFGTPEIWSKLADCNSDPTLEAEDSRMALLRVLLAIREAVLPREPSPDGAIANRLVFGSRG